ncbi:MAG: response regulator transcription factor [Methylotenera sp.]|nr:response regulator transcription factor [Methylotenera sp.]
MQDTFVSKLAEPIISWVQAFPELNIISEIVCNINTSAYSNESTVFWLHINDEQPDWLASTINKIIKESPSVKVVVLTNLPSHTQCFSALEAGAVGYVHAYSSPDVLREVKQVITHGGIWLGAELLQKLIETTTKLTSNKSIYVNNLLSQLTLREKDVAIEVAKGLSNKEVARTLNITERTVKAHLAAVFDRLGAKDRLQLALMLNKG